MLVIAAAVLAALAPVAAADQPVDGRLRAIDRTFTFPAGPGACPFPFIVHS
jgi:hypothetical protein